VQYSGSGHWWKIVLRIEPEGGDPVYLADRVELPPILRPEFTGRTAGAFLLGEGRYSVRLAVSDDQGRTCREHWQIEAAPSRDQRAVKPLMPAHRIADLSLTGTPDSASRTNLRVTLLVNSSTPYVPPYVNDPYVFNRAIVPNPYLMPDWLLPSAVDYRMELIGMVAALVERLPGASIRLLMFDLDNRTEIFRQDGFALKNIDAVEHAANSVERWKVDVRTLQNQPSRWNFLVDFVKREFQGSEPSDTVVFLGARNGNGEKLPRGFPAAKTAGGLRFFYLQYNPYRDQVYAGIPPEMTSERPRRNAWPGLPEFERPVLSRNLPDTIHMWVRGLKGKTLRVFSPADFAKAVEAIRK
jgi:hypothetical protein